MKDDARGAALGETTIQSDVCIIGAGPAGLVIAAELAAAGRHVVLLESGTRADDERVQALNDGDVVGDEYAGLRETRRRGVGGTSMLWNTPTPGGPGAKYVPLDPWDCSPRWPDAPAGWPLPFDELRSFYVRAQGLCGLGGFAYDAESWTSDAVRAPLTLAGSGLTTRVYQVGARTALIAPLLEAVTRAPNVQLCTDATVVHLAVERARGVVTVAGSGGKRWRVQAPRLVLAAGAVENARLLLVACAGDGGVADRSGWLGRGFMEHPRDRALTLMPSDAGSYRALGFYDMHGAADGTTIVGRLGLEAETARRGDLLNASATLFPIVRPHRARLRTALGRAGTMQALRRWLPAGGHGWSSHPEPGRVFDGFSVLLNVEQPPRAENAIVLGDRRDVHGTPLPVLHWRWHPEDHARLERLRRVIAQSLEGAGIGRVTIDAAARPDPNARHHAGTTRMDVDARHGVVDADGRVHGTDTLFVVGASTFPTAGFANPMLTIVAMALRLAEKLRAER